MHPLIKKIAAVFIPVAALVCGATLLSYHSERARIESEFIDQSRESVRVARGQMIARMGMLASDIRYLARSHALLGYLRVPGDDTLADLQTDWRSFAESRGAYDQIRLIDETGQERVRINFDSARGLALVPLELQFKGDRYYWRDTMALPRGGIYASDLDLNVEHGVIERPLKPVMRLGIPVFAENGRKWGAVVLNYLGRNVLDHLLRNGRGPLWLVNREGYWMRGPNPDIEWGFMFGARQNTIQAQYPDQWARIQASDAGNFEDDQGIWTFATVNPADVLALDHPHGAQAGGNEAMSWKLVDFLPRETLDKALSVSAWTHVGVTLFMLAVLFAGARRTAVAMVAEENSRHALERINRELERRVSERTRKLATEVETRRQSEKMLAHRVTHDALTGLANREAAEEAFVKLTTPCIDEGAQLALVFIDIDDFKLVNDHLGHPSGDELLRVIAHRLSHGAREGDILARYGGDEFLMLIQLPGGTADLNATINRLMHHFDDSFELDGHHVKITVSLGLALFPLDASDWPGLLKAADTALYEAKRRGKGLHYLYSSDLAAHLKDRFELTAALRAAVAAQEIEVHFQPKIDGGGALRGFEALARWHRPGQGPVSPEQFIHIAEDTGLIVELGRQVLTRACTEASAWFQATGRPLTVAVNLSPRQLGRGLWEQVDDILLQTGLPAQLLELEVTENLLMRDTQWAVDILGRLRERGIRIAVDDFGTGYSSLSYLRKLPIDTLKIDRSFVSHCEQEGEAMAIPHAVIFLGKSLNLNVVAEGVELASQFDVLRRCGCDEFQGYWISRPMDATQTRAFIDAGFRPADWPGEWGRVPEMA